jgi:hypothetical protein
MKFLQTTVVLGLLCALASAKLVVPDFRRLEEEDSSHGGAVRRRYLPKGDSQGKNAKGGGGSNAADETIDRSGGYDSCLPFASLSSGVIASTKQRDLTVGGTNACLTENACNTGCCRIYNWLQCDEVNEYYWLEVRRVGPNSIVIGSNNNTTTKTRIAF